MKRAIIIAALATLAFPVGAQASPADNALQPPNTYFGTVRAGHHPTAVVTVKNGTGHRVQITRFLIAGAGGEKFTLVGSQPGGAVATCAVTRPLRANETCTIILRVKTTKVGWWQSAVNVFYGSNQFNGAVYAHVVK